MNDYEEMAYYLEDCEDHAPIMLYPYEIDFLKNFKKNLGGRNDNTI